MTYTYKIKTKLGTITLASDGTNLTGLWLDTQKPNIKKDAVNKQLPIFIETEKWLEEYFNQKTPKSNPPLKLEGTNFQKDVWEILKQIPYGKTTTYGDIAKTLEKKYQRKMSAQAVGRAVGKNPISIIVPCHRVVGSNGNLTGYAGGIDKKIKLLQIEQINMDNLFVPDKNA